GTGDGRGDKRFMQLHCTRLLSDLPEFSGSRLQDHLTGSGRFRTVPFVSLTDAEHEGRTRSASDPDVLVPAKELYQIVKTETAPKLEVRIRGDKLELHANNRSLVLPCSEPKNFPQIPDGELKLQGQILASALDAALHRVLFCVSAEAGADVLRLEMRDSVFPEAIRGVSPRARDCTQRRCRYKDRVDEAERARNRTKSRVRSKVEHVFGILKLKFGFTRVRYRGLKKNANRLFATLALVNLYAVRKKLLATTLSQSRVSESLQAANEPAASNKDIVGLLRIRAPPRS